MPLLQVTELTFGYGAESLFSGVSFRLERGERAGLVAPNGAGKSTLLRIVAGELNADRGSVVVDKGARTGFYRQSHELGREGTVLDALLSGFREVLALRHELEAAQRAAASGSERDLARLAEVTERHHAAGADAVEHRVAAIATRLGFPPADLERPVESLSGGERGRLELGAVLAGEPDLLLLDEPTNHLDLDTIDWLGTLLTNGSGTKLIVSHDRAFLDAVCPVTLELGRTRFRVYSMPFSQYEAERTEDLERERKRAEEQAAFIDKTEEFIRKNIAGQKTKQAQSRRRMLEKLDRLDQPEDVWRAAGRVRFKFTEAPRSGDIVLEANGLGATRGGRVLFDGFDLLVRRGERVGVVGPNGCGKTTLLALLAGQGSPEDRGGIRHGANLYEGYYDQHLGSLDPSRTAIDEVRSIRGELSVDAARQYLARFRLHGDDPFRRVESLSGGERSRLALAKLLLEPKNLLFFDEPTNHLDIFATKILEEALLGFEGTVVLVSHDRRLLENVTTRTIVFSPEGAGQSAEGGARKLASIYPGGFADYWRSLKRPTQSEPLPAKPAKAPAPASPPAARHQERREAQRELERKRRRAQRLEEQIAEAESELADLREKLRQAPGDDWERLHELCDKEQALVRKVDAMLKEWESLSLELEKAAEGPAAEQGEGA